jgi:hypothetical protein
MTGFCPPPFLSPPWPRLCPHHFLHHLVSPQGDTRVLAWGGTTLLVGTENYHQVASRVVSPQWQVPRVDRTKGLMSPRSRLDDQGSRSGCGVLTAVTRGRQAHRTAN